MLQSQKKKLSVYCFRGTNNRLSLLEVGLIRVFDR